MIPIHELLSRLRWDRKLARRSHEIGYFDRVERCIIRVPLSKVRFPPDRRHVFEIEDAAGVRRRIPFHRVREVVESGRRIWHRPESPRPGRQAPREKLSHTSRSGNRRTDQDFGGRRFVAAAPVARR
jgi:uncharacterized protein (UPF0248 family)